MKGINWLAGVLLLGTSCASLEPAPSVADDDYAKGNLAQFDAQVIVLDAHPEWQDETTFTISLRRASRDCDLVPATFVASVNDQALEMIEDGLVEAVYEPNKEFNCGPVVFQGALSLLQSPHSRILVEDATARIVYELAEPLTTRSLSPRGDALVFDRGAEIEFDWISPTLDDVSYDGGAFGYIDDGALPIVERVRIRSLDDGGIGATLPSEWTGPFQVVVSYPGRQLAMTCEGIEVCTHWVQARFDRWITIE